MTQLILRECEDCGGMMAFAFDGETALFLVGSALVWLDYEVCQCAGTPARTATLEAEIAEEEREDCQA